MSNTDNQNKSLFQMEAALPPLIERFINPPNEFRMMPFWFWNHEMVEKEVQRQIRDQYEHGLGGTFIHPRHGRLTPYMGRRWLENVEAAADQCKELDIPCFLYDEDNWPSGPVSGLIVGPYRPENRGKFLALLDEEDFEGPGQVEYEIDYKSISPETEFFAAIAVPTPEKYPNFSSVVDKWIDVSKNVHDEKFTWNVPEGDWTVIFFCVLINSPDVRMGGYIDILRKETVKEFIDKTHKKYVDYFIEKGKKDYLGTVVPGIFTDEPSLLHMQVKDAMLAKWIIFTPEFPKKFEQKYKIPFSECLLPMFYDCGPLSAKYRTMYWDLVIELYVDSFYKQIYDFCEQYNWRATGHVNAEGSMPTHFLNQGDFFRVFEYFHYGGCDQLTEEVRPDGIENIWNLKKNPYFGMAMDVLLASKLASSAAHLLNKPRVLVEVFGTSSWTITLGSAKRISDYLIATGCDLFVPHSFNYSEDGYRKGDHPAAFNYEPYYIHWKKLMDHNARLSAILNAHSGTPNTPFLYLYPAETFHAEFDPGSNNLTDILGVLLNHNADNLFRQQIDFEISNEKIILNSEIVVEDSTNQTKTEEKSTNNQNTLKKLTSIKINNQKFRVLLLNGTTTISEKFADFLLKFYNKGGKIIATQTLPFKAVAIGRSQKVIDIIKKIFGIQPEEHFNKFIKKEIVEVSLHQNNNKNGGMAIFISTPFKPAYQLPYYPIFEEVCRRVYSLNERDMGVWKAGSINFTDLEERKTQYIHANYIIGLHKTIEEKEVYFFTNTSKELEYAGCIVYLGKTAERIELWDTENGKRYLIDETFLIREKQNEKGNGKRNGKVMIFLDFPINQSYLIVCYNGKDMKNEELPVWCPPILFNPEKREKLIKKQISQNSPSDGKIDTDTSKNTDTNKNTDKNTINKEAINNNNQHNGKCKGQIIKTINIEGDWDYKTPDPVVAMLKDKWNFSVEVEAIKAFSYRSSRTFTHDFIINELETIKKAGKIKIVIEGLAGDYAWAKTTFMTLQGGDRAHFTIPREVRVKVNGKTIPLRHDFEVKYLDPAWIVADITSALVEGKNTIEFRCDTGGASTFHMVTDPWRILGQFSVKVIEGIPHLTPLPKKITLGDLTDAGLARYHGAIHYYKNIEIPKIENADKILLELPNSIDCIEVKINDKEIETLWHNWVLDITDVIKQGAVNKLEFIHYGDAHNVLQTNLHRFGLEGPINIHILKSNK